MSAELFQVLALFSRYLFVLLGALTAVWSFLWLLADLRERRIRLRSIPNAGFIGEFVVVSGSRELPEGHSIPVPWEGILGSVRTADLCVPCGGVQRSHLSFSFEPGMGLLISPLSGREALVNGAVINCHSRPESAPLAHGSFLQVGSALLRLRVFAGLDPGAGFDAAEAGGALTAAPQSWNDPPQDYPGYAGYAVPQIPDAQGQGSPEYNASLTGMPPVQPGPAYFAPLINMDLPESRPDETCAQIEGASPPDCSGMVDPQASPGEGLVTEAFQSRRPVRRRRADRWEADWSE